MTNSAVKAPNCDPCAVGAN